MVPPRYDVKNIMITPSMYLRFLIFWCKPFNVFIIVISIFLLWLLFQIWLWPRSFFATKEEKLGSFSWRLRISILTKFSNARWFSKTLRWPLPLLHQVQNIILSISIRDVGEDEFCVEFYEYPSHLFLVQFKSKFSSVEF